MAFKLCPYTLSTASCKCNARIALHLHFTVLYIVVVVVSSMVAMDSCIQIYLGQDDFEQFYLFGMSTGEKLSALKPKGLYVNTYMLKRFSR